MESYEPYLLVELSAKEVEKIVKENLVQDEKALNPTEYAIEFKYDEDYDEFVIIIIKETYLLGYKGSIREELDEDDVLELLKVKFEDNDRTFDSYEAIYDTSPTDSDSKILKGINLKYELASLKNESFVKKM